MPNFVLVHGEIINLDNVINFFRGVVPAYDGDGYAEYNDDGEPVTDLCTFYRVVGSDDDHVVRDQNGGADLWNYLVEQAIPFCPDRAREYIQRPIAPDPQDEMVGEPGSAP